MPSVLMLGASSDMAMAIASVFASKGYSIQLAARQVGRLEALRSDLNIRFGISCTLHEFDVLNFESHAAFFDQLPEKPDISVFVIGYLGDNEIARTNWKEAFRIMETNYVGAVSILNIIAAHYQSWKKGSIIGISSVAGERGRQSNYIYGSAKAGLTAYLSGLRNRLYRDHVHVMSVQPGFVYTRMTEELKLPALLTATPEQVAAAVYRAYCLRKNIVFVRWYWRWIMLLIRNIPEFIFKKLSL